jgi:hypothetical protein
MSHTNTAHARVPANHTTLETLPELDTYTEFDRLVTSLVLLSDWDAEATSTDIPESHPSSSRCNRSGPSSSRDNGETHALLGGNGGLSETEPSTLE